MRLFAGLLSSLLLAVFCVGYALNAGQDINWDLQNYHLYAPYAFLTDRHLFDLSPAGLQSYFNPTVYLPYYWLLQQVSPQLTASLLALLQSLNFLLVFAIALQLLPEKAGKTGLAVALALLGIFSAGFISEIGTTQFDNVMSLFVLSALLGVLHALHKVSRSQRYGHVAMAGFVAGIGCAFKLVLGVYALGLCIALLFLRHPLKERLQLGFYFSLGVIGGLLVFGGYWYLFLMEHFGSPVFPLFNSLFGGELAQTISNRDDRFLPASVLDYLAYPVIFTLNPLRVSEVAYQQYSWLVIYLLVGWFALHRLFTSLRHFDNRNPLSDSERLLLGFFIVSFCLWLVLFGIYRYLVSLELLIPLLAMVLLGNLYSRRIVQYAGLSGLACLSLINSDGAADWGHAGWSDQLYSVEIPDGFDGVDKVFLIGQPLAWLVVAFDVDKPFIQMGPNYPVSETYINRVREHAASGESVGFIYDPSTLELDADIPEDVIRGFFPPEFDIDFNAHNTVLQLYFGMEVDEVQCREFYGTLGQTRFNYQFCVRRDSSAAQF